jgi:hypothetical protein
LANTAGAGSDEPSAMYDAMEQVSFNYHISRWCKCFSELSEKCLICHNSAQGNRHSPSKCPILKKLGLKLKKHSATDNSNNLAARVASDNSSSTATTPAPAPASASNGRSTNILGACTASTEAESYNSGKEFDYKGKYEGLLYAGESKPSKISSLYLPVSPLCSHSLSKISYDDPPTQVSTTSNTSSSLVAGDPKGVTTICLPKNVMALLNNPPSHSIKTFSDAHCPRTSLLVADTGVINHMIPDKSAFISYPPCSG